MTAKTAAAASVPATIQAGKGVIAIPAMDSAEAIKYRLADDPSQSSDETPTVPAFTNGMGRCLATEHQSDKRERS